MNKRQAPVICQLFLIAAFGLIGCAETKNWTLSYSATSASVPDLVLVFRLDGTGDSAGLKANFNTSSSNINFQPTELKNLLDACADEVATSDPTKTGCVELADHVGSVLFRGTPQVFNATNSSANKNGSIGVSGNTSRFFVLFLYRMSEKISATDDRCMKLVEAVKAANGFTVQDGTGKNLHIDVDRGSASGAPENRDCFPLGI